MIENKNLNEEIEIKHSRVRKLLESRKIDGLLLSRHSSFKWFSCGHKNDVIKSDDTSLVNLLITPRKRFLISTNSDASRVMEEELSGLGFELIVYKWYEQDVFDAIKKIKSDIKLGTDFLTDRGVYLGNEIAEIRTVLTKFELDRYKKMCSEYTGILTEYCRMLKPGQSEIEIAAGLAFDCLRSGIRLPVLMVGSDERIFKYRHPCATQKKVDKYILIATVAEREGICANISRSVYFGRVPDELFSKQDSVNEIQVNYQYHSGPGVTLGELLEVGKESYKKAGFNGEWENHLQGGISGYTPLEFLAVSNSRVKVRENNVMSWNPTVKGAKSEDPVLVTAEEVVQLSIDSRWPGKEYKVGGRKFIIPLIMEL